MMINRKALWISLIVLVAMIAADFWRLRLLPDWRYVPLEGPGSRSISVLLFFVPVLMILFMMGVFFAQRWFISGREEAMQTWKRAYGAMLIFSTAMGASLEAFNIARSLGALQSVDRLTLGHVILVTGGIVMMLVGNMMPKMPWLTARFRYAQLDPWQWNRQVRFAGKLMVLFGLFIAVVMPLLPQKIAGPAMLGSTLVFIVVNHWHRAKVKREPSPQP